MTGDWTISGYCYPKVSQLPGNNILKLEISGYGYLDIGLEFFPFGQFQSIATQRMQIGEFPDSVTRKFTISGTILGNLSFSEYGFPEISQPQSHATWHHSN